MDKQTMKIPGEKSKNFYDGARRDILSLQQRQTISKDEIVRFYGINEVLVIFIAHSLWHACSVMSDNRTACSCSLSKCVESRAH